MNDNFDEFLRQSFKSLELQVDLSDGCIEEIILQKYQQNEREHKRKRRHILQVAVILISLLGVAGATVFPESVQAFKKQLFQTVNNMGKTLNINLSSAQPQYLSLSKKMQSEISDMQEQVPFKIQVPRYVPEGFELQNIEKIKPEETNDFIMTFVKTDKSISFTQFKVSPAFTMSVNTDAATSKSETIQVGRYETNMITFFDGVCTLIWLTEDHILCDLSGDITSDQAIEMCLSTQ